MKWIGRILTGVVLIFPGFVEAQTAAAGADLANVPLRVLLEDAATGLVAAQIKRNSAGQEVVGTMDAIQPGSLTLDLSSLEPDSYFIFLSSPGYATQWITLVIKNGTAELKTKDLTLFRKRYAIIRYAVNSTGKRGLDTADVVQGLMAVAHWGALPYFHGDWQIWQHLGELTLEFHRYSPAYGFARPPQDATFESLTEAPPNDQYKAENIKTTKGLLLFCRVHGNVAKDECYAKLLIEDVTETPPVGVEIFDSTR